MLGGLSLGAQAQVLPFRLPLPGIIGTIANGIVQGAAAGGIVFGGFVVSGYAVSAVDGMMGATLVGKFRRPLLFAALAGVTGGVVSMLAPKGKKALWGLLAAAGPGLRAIAGIFAGIDALPAAIKGPAGQLSDYIQVGDEVPGSEGVGDYIQVGDLYEAGMGEDDEEVGALYEAGMGEDDEAPF